MHVWRFQWIMGITSLEALKVASGQIIERSDLSHMTFVGERLTTEFRTCMKSLPCTDVKM